MSAPIHLRAAGVSVLVDVGGGRLPRVLHWGADLGANGGVNDLARALTPAVIPGGLDVAVVAEVVPQHSTGWLGLPGLRGHRDGRDWSPLLASPEVDVTADGSTGGSVVVQASDPVARLSLTCELRLETSGLLRVRASVTNDDAEAPFIVDGLVTALPVPIEADEMLDLTGRWTRERSPQRGPVLVGSHVRDIRSGRTGHDSPTLLCVGQRGFGFRRGQVWAVHVAYSGNQRTYVERLPSATTVLGGGELLFSGEVRLEPGKTYQGPWLVASYGDGLDEVSARIHRWLRDRDNHPRPPRPVVLNTWEAVYFDHDLSTLTGLADTAASVGVERFVLDDGWFRGRRDDTAGLGDWTVDTEVWPGGLHPLAEHVTGLGMELGLWVEPEMVNPDSDLARAHPEWLLGTGGRVPPESRHQQVLDLGHASAYDYVLGHLDALLVEYPIAFLKWDHNRVLIDAGHSPDGEPGVRQQTLALYRLMDELRARHPGLEIESCSSGGGRVDLEILQRTDRVWTSDCNDALERQQIQRWTGLIVPPEMLGAHVGPEASHTTGRRHGLSFRAGTALFGHFGIEWDITSAEADRAELARWITLYKRLRPLLHGGQVVRADDPDPARLVHGVVSASRDHAVFAVVGMATSVFSPPPPVRLPGLSRAATYDIVALEPGAAPPGVGSPPWLPGPLRLSGAALADAGLAMPAMWPEQLLLLEVTAA
jgi:alpha-galactosidase